ncbi:MAG: hypothetical protein JWM88_2600 [Verrucomicrobia bacterium]|nr:hypothetical protein [Verrucomicrobiota bacterium]
MTSTAPSTGFLALFRRRLGDRPALPFAEFMELALYDREQGYYRQARPRVGYGSGTDFFTASTSGPIFGELICAAAVTLLAGKNLREFTFVELGAEPETSVLDRVEHPFGAVRTLRVADAVTLAGPCVVFSNELFDAQPFRRFIFERGAWRELAVAERGGGLAETTIAATAPGVFPKVAPEGYVIDAPLAAVELLRRIAGQPWKGLFLAADYGKSWRELAEATPQGTARAFFQHTQSNDLLARPGSQDLTAHVCWDWLAAALEEAGFGPAIVESQEAFFIRHAADFISATAAAEAARFSRKKLSLLQLLHPSHLGQKFQVLHAQRL